MWQIGSYGTHATINVGLYN